MCAAPSKGHGVVRRVVGTTWGATKTIAKATFATGLAVSTALVGVPAYLTYKTIKGAKYLLIG